MKRKTRNFLFALLNVLIALSLVLAVTGYILPRRSFPQTEGEIRMLGLDAVVDIFRDAYGIPHIYAQTSRDLFFTQGYVHAQDRFYQMDFWRHIGSGRLAEMFGEAQLETDIFLRTLGWARVAEQELARMEPDELVLLQAYSDGVNTYLVDHQGAALSLEYAVIRLLAPDYRPEAWKPLHTLTWAKAMAWELGNSRLYSEVEHAILQGSLTTEQMADLYPPYPSDHPVVVPGGTVDASLTPAISPHWGAEFAPAFEAVASRLHLLEDVLGPLGRGIGSNNWVIAGTRTTTGMPLLANDMHLAEQMPAIWYEIGLHCAPKSAQCPYEVVGYSFAGVPGAIVGHTDRVAWGFTNVGPDVLDLYIEKINPQNPNQYEVNGEWVDMQSVQETLRTSGGEPVEITVRYTRHGPVIWDSAEERAEVEQKWALDLPNEFAIAVRWTALEPTDMIKAILGYNRAQNWDEFRQAASFFAAPSQNMVYADVDGNIGYQTPGLIPIRQQGHSGLLPVPGWTDDYEWQGYIPFEELPTTINPPQGYIVSANNAVVGPEYSYSIAVEWDYGFRAARIVEMIKQAPGMIGAGYIQQMHGDNKNLSAVYMLPMLMGLSLDDPHLVEVRALLQDWDYQDHMDLAAPALYNAFWRSLLAHTFHDELPEDYWPSGEDNSFEVVRRLVEQTDSAWWDDQTTLVVERRDDILRLALADAVAELEEALGKDYDGWTWGDLHTTIFHNQTLGLSGVAPIEALFNRGGFRTSGGGSIVNATSWNLDDPQDETAYQVAWLPSMRMIIDLGDLPASISVNTTGQSGHAYHPHYIDQADLWRMIQYHPMQWDRAQIEADAEGHLRLVP